VIGIKEEPTQLAAEPELSMLQKVGGGLLGLILLAIVAMLYMASRRRRGELARNPQHPEVQGQPMRTGIGVRLGLPPASVQHITTSTRLAGPEIRGRLTEIVSVQVSGQVPTEYRDGNRRAIADGQTAYLGVYREGEEVTNVTAHWFFCLNGILMSTMSAIDAGVLVSNMRNPQRIHTQSGYNQSFDFEPIRTWLVTRYGTEAPAPVDEQTEQPQLQVVEVQIGPEPLRVMAASVVRNFRASSSDARVTLGLDSTTIEFNGESLQLGVGSIVRRTREGVSIMANGHNLEILLRQPNIAVGTETTGQPLTRAVGRAASGD
jgi:hypothetical protein